MAAFLLRAAAPTLSKLTVSLDASALGGLLEKKAGEAMMGDGRGKTGRNKAKSWSNFQTQAISTMSLSESLEHSKVVED